MATPKQIAANRANAQKSTGPRTPAGKATSARNGALSRGPRTPAGRARSRWNALQHGLRSRALIPEALQGQESPAEFAALHRALRHELAPATPFEEILVETIAAGYWRLARIQAAESRGIVTAQNLRRADLECFAPPPTEPAAESLPDPQALLPEHITVPASHEILILLRYESHIERQIRSAYQLLQYVQGRRRAQPGPPDPAARALGFAGGKLDSTERT